MPLRRKNTRAKQDEMLTVLMSLRADIDIAYRNLDTVTDDDLIDGFIYELKAANMKYSYYLKLCKERGIIQSQSNISA
jgi:hypothetical protein